MIEQSQKWCAGIMRTHAKSFYFSTRILPRAKREAVEALYGLFRTADDLADEPGLPIAQRRAEFAAIKQTLSGMHDENVDSDAPWFPAVRRAFSRFPIDVRDALRLIEGCESDLVPSNIASMADVERYSAAVAGTVGRTSMPILGAPDADSLDRGERLGIAMQLTNILRDVEEDARLGRDYLPRAAFPGMQTEDLMRILALRARELYSEASVLASRVPNDGSRVALLMTADIYGGILDHLERRGFDPTRGRVFVPMPEKLFRAARCVGRAYIGRVTIR